MQIIEQPVLLILSRAIVDVDADSLMGAKLGRVQNARG